jgi:transposase
MDDTSWRPWPTSATSPGSPARSHVASWTGTAPIDASRGQQIRHRLSRAGNRRINHVLYMAGFVQLRHDTPGRRYYRRRVADGKASMEAMRCLRRRLSDVVYRQLVQDASARSPREPGLGRALGGVCVIQRGRPHPGRRLFGSAAPRAREPDATPARSCQEPRRSGIGESRLRRAGGVNVQRPTGRTTLTPTSAAASWEASRTRS